MRAKNAEPRRFTRDDLERGPREVLSQGRWANAVLYRFEHDGVTWVVKDFRPRARAVRLLLGRFLVHRELRALRLVAGIPATPEDVFRVDADALAYRFVRGRSLRGAHDLVFGPDFFPTLERTLATMHSEAGLAHFDLRNAKNILLTDSGEPLLLDFQTAVSTGWMPAPLRRFAERVDLAAIYKHWKKRSPATMGDARLEALARMNRIRPLWALRGYIGAPRPPRRKRDPCTVPPTASPGGLPLLDAIHDLFNNPTLRKVLVKSRVLLGVVIVGLIIWKLDPRWLLPGFLVSMFGEAIQLWCFASLDKGRTLAFNGPYALVRNPMYLGRYFILLGGLMLLGNVWLLLLFTVVYYFYMVNRVKREEEYLRGPLGAPYEDYLRTVNRFLPGAPKPGSRLGFWDWKLLKRNHGTTNLIATLAFWFAAWAWARFGLGA